MTITTHNAVIGVVSDLIGNHCGRPYQKLRVAVECNGEEPDELVTILSDYNAKYKPHDRVKVVRSRRHNIVSYRIVK